MNIYEENGNYYWIKYKFRSILKTNFGQTFALIMSAQRVLQSIAVNAVTMFATEGGVTSDAFTSRPICGRLVTITGSEPEVVTVLHTFVVMTETAITVVVASALLPLTTWLNARTRFWKANTDIISSVITIQLTYGLLTVGWRVVIRT